MAVSSPQQICSPSARVRAGGQGTGYHSGGWSGEARSERRHGRGAGAEGNPVGGRAPSQSATTVTRGSLIYGVGDGYLGDRALAEDLVQDAFTAVWRGAGGLIPSGRASRRGFIASRATGRRT